MSVQFVRLFTGLVNARLLTPFLYATTASAGVVARYASYSHFGVQNGLNRQLPVEIGRDDQKRAVDFQTTAFWCVSLAAAVLTAAGGALFLADWTPVGAIPRAYYPDVTLLCVTGLYFQYFTSLLVSTQRFGILSRIRLVFEVATPVVGVLGVWLFRVHGLLLTQSAFMVVQAVFMARRGGFRLHLRFSSRQAAFLIRIGLPILAASFLAYTLTTVPFLYVTAHFPTYQVGLYGLALTGAAFFRTYTTTLSDIMAPKMGNVFGGENERPQSLRRFATSYTFLFVPLVGMIGAVFIFLLPVLISVGLPMYRDSIAPLQYLLLAEYVLAVYIPSGHVTTLLKKQPQTIALTLVATGAVLLLQRVVLGPNASLRDVALVWALVATGLSLGVILLANHYVRSFAEHDARSLNRAVIALATVLATIYAAIAVLGRLHGAAFVIGQLAALAFTEIVCLAILITFDRDNPLVRKLVASLPGRNATV